MPGAENFVRFRCSKCGKQLKASPNQAGAKVGCPACGERQQVPAEEPASGEYRVLPGIDQPPAESKIVYGRYIRVVCPLCHSQMQAREDQVGQKIQCPDCMLPVVVPPPAAAVVKKQAPDMAADVYNVSSRSWDEAEPPSNKRQFTIKCPLCHSQMDASEDQVGDAIRCPDCNTKVMVRMPPAKQQFHVAENFSDDLRVGGTFERPPVELPPSHAAERGEHARERAAHLGLYDVPDERRGAPVRGREPEQLPDWPLVSGVFTFLFYPGALSRWIIQSVALILVGGMCGFAAQFGRMGLFFLFILIPIGIVWAITVAARFTAIVQETSAGNDVIEEWPDSQFLDWAGEIFYLLNSFAVSLMPGVGASFFFPDDVQSQAICIVASVFVLFPILLLASLEAASPFFPVSGVIFLSLLTAWWAWLLFYVEAALLAAAAGGLSALAIQYLGLPGLIPTAFIGMGAMFIYFRLLGRMAWYCAPAEGAKNEEEESGPSGSGHEMDQLSRIMIA